MNASVDIPQDFRIYPGHWKSVQVPERGTGLLFTADNSFFTDTSDPNGDFGARIRYRVPITNPKCMMEESEEEELKEGFS